MGSGAGNLKTALPISPILMILLSGMLMVLALVISQMEPNSEFKFKQSNYEASTDLSVSAPLVLDDAMSAARSISTIINSSGFSQARARYERVISKPIRAEPKLDPKFIGRLGRGPDQRVMIVWRSGEDAKVLGIGDETPWGRLTGISDGDIQFENNGDRKTLNMFE